MRVVAAFFVSASGNDGVDQALRPVVCLTPLSFTATDVDVVGKRENEGAGVLDPSGYIEDSLEDLAVELIVIRRDVDVPGCK